MAAVTNRIPSGGLWGTVKELLVYVAILGAGTVVVTLLPGPQWVKPILVFFYMGTFFVWLFVREQGWDYIDIRRPTLKQVGIVAAILIAYYGVITVYGFVLAEFTPNVSPASHGTMTEQTTELDYATTLFVLGVIAAAPVEELIFRNGLQKSLYGRLGGIGAIIATSLFFASLHIPAYGGLSGMDVGLLVSLSVVFLGSALYGLAYLWTENLLVPILIHAIMNGTAIVGAYLHG